MTRCVRRATGIPRRHADFNITRVQSVVISFKIVPRYQHWCFPKPSQSKLDTLPGNLSRSLQIDASSSSSAIGLDHAAQMLPTTAAGASLNCCLLMLHEVIVKTQANQSRYEYLKLNSVWARSV